LVVAELVVVVAWRKSLAASPAVKSGAPAVVAGGSTFWVSLPLYDDGATEIGTVIEFDLVHPRAPRSPVTTGIVVKSSYNPIETYSPFSQFDAPARARDTVFRQFG
jgi:hypothetical protein